MKKSIITLIIFAFALNSCGIFRKTETHPDPRTHDEGVVINGVRWATRNVDMPGTFAENPENKGSHFIWDEARNNPCPTGWRAPTVWELRSLHNTIGKCTTLNGINGRFFGAYPNQVFLPAAGLRNPIGTLGSAGWGYYWSNTKNEHTVLGGYVLWFFANTHSGVVGINGVNGVSVRCVSIN